MFFHGVITQVPKFSESGLPSGRALRSKVFSTNAKGRSDTVVLKVYTLKDLAEKRTGELYSCRQYFSFTSTLLIFRGCCPSFLCHLLPRPTVSSRARAVFFPSHHTFFYLWRSNVPLNSHTFDPYKDLVHSLVNRVTTVGIILLYTPVYVWKTHWR